MNQKKGKREERNGNIREGHFPTMMGKRHLFVLVHGNHGHKDDMAPIRSTLETRFPGSVFLMSSSNTPDTHCGVVHGGNRLAIETSGS